MRTAVTIEGVTLNPVPDFPGYTMHIAGERFVLEPFRASTFEEQCWKLIDEHWDTRATFSELRLAVQHAKRVAGPWTRRAHIGNRRAA